MAPKTFMIAGAAGSTGRSATEVALGQGFAVRALVHRKDQRSMALERAGAEVVVGDMLNPDDVRRSMEGVDAAYFVYPIMPHLIEAATYFAEAAKAAGVSSVVNMSQASARRDAASHAARDHWVVERLFDWTGLSVTHLRPTFFAQNFLDPVILAAIVERGVISFPFGTGRHAPIAAEDQGRLIAAILVDPMPHRGKTYPVRGPVEMDHFAIAQMMSETLGRPVEYEAADIDEWGARVPLPAFLVQHLRGIAPDYQAGIFAGTDAIIEKVTGVAPMTFRAFLAAHQAELDLASSQPFRPPAAEPLASAR